MDYRKQIFDWMIEARVKKEGDELLMLALADGLSRLIALHFELDKTRADKFMDVMFSDLRRNTLAHMTKFETVVEALRQCNAPETKIERVDFSTGEHIETITAEEYLRDYFNPEKPNG